MEEWRQIPWYPFYSVSSSGRVRNDRNGHILKQFWSRNNHPDGRLRVAISYEKAYVHQLVAKMFIPNPEKKPQIDHIDRNPSNNDVSNLRWATQSENMLNRDQPLGKSGHKSIFHRKDKFLVDIKRKYGPSFCKVFPTLQEAIQARDNFLNNQSAN